MVVQLATGSGTTEKQEKKGFENRSVQYYWKYVSFFAFFLAAEVGQ